MSLSIARTFIRRPIMGRLTIRNASTTSEATNAASKTAAKAKETASSATSKASEGLTRVTSAAGPAISKAASSATAAINGIGGRTGRLISFVQSLIPPTVYYGRVGLELARLVAQGQKMSPPTMATFQSYTQPLLNAARNPSAIFNQAANTAGSQTPNSILSSFRNIDNQSLIAGAVVAAEVIGFFSVGEMIGRFKIIGYRTSHPAGQQAV